MDIAAVDVNAYCVMCRTGSEKSAAMAINRHYPELTAIAPVKILQEKRSGQWDNREQLLLPGYIFLFTDRALPLNLREAVNNLYKTLEYEKGMRSLTGCDEDYAMWIYKHNGKIEPSRVILKEGQGIKVIDGPLLDCRGTIIKIDKHKRRAIVAFTFDGQKRTVSISTECTQPIES